MSEEKVSCGGSTEAGSVCSEGVSAVGGTQGSLIPSASAADNNSLNLPSRPVPDNNAARVWDCLKRADRVFGLFGLVGKNCPGEQKVKTPSDYLAWLLDMAAHEQGEAAREDEQAERESYGSALETYEGEASIAEHYRTSVCYLEVAVELALMGVRAPARRDREG